MANFLAIMQLVLQLIPVLNSTIKAIEEAMPQGGQGAAKLEMVRAAMEAAYKNFNSATVTFEQLWPSLKATITSIVEIYNAVGVFNKKAIDGK